MAAAATATAAPATNASRPLSDRSVAAAPPKKKSKAGIVVGGLVGLLLLVGIAGSGGWFAYTRFYLPSRAGAESSPSPSPQPTAPMLADANQNQNSNSAAGLANDANSADDNSNRPVVTGGPSPRSTPQAVVKGTPAQTAKPPDAKARPKPKANDPRKTILP